MNSQNPNLHSAKGDVWIWSTSAAFAFILLIVASLIGIVMINGLGVFWPHAVYQATLRDGRTVIGEIVKREAVPNTPGSRLQFKIGNRDLNGLDYLWVPETNMITLVRSPDLVVVERLEHGNFYGVLTDVIFAGRSESTGDRWVQLEKALRQTRDALRPVRQLADKLYRLSQTHEQLRLKWLKHKYRFGDQTPQVRIIEREQTLLKEAMNHVATEQEKRLTEIRQTGIIMKDAAGREKTIACADMVRAYRPNRDSLFEKGILYAEKLGELLSAEPRESNTEGGIFPALFGTILMVFLMSLLSFPLGVMGGIYLREYAKEGWLVKTVRIAVNNLAGIPSIVFGVFGLGFFVYGVGGSIDALFFPERLPTPTYGTGGILWASLTLGLLTIPVVIVSTEEALGAIPRGIQESSLALGATQFQTLTRLLLPMASPGILTGFILAMARAAGEVAPLMITGVVKLAPTMPFDGVAPFFHPERKFMHLGFHIYDIGFQSPNVEAAKPMVYITALLLVLVVLLMTSSAIFLRNRMKQRYTVKTL